MLLREESADKLTNVAEELIIGLEKWCATFNRFAVTFFWYLKYIFAFILLAIGVLTLIKLRGIYRVERVKGYKYSPKSENPLYKSRLAIGVFYIIMSLGIMFNFLIYFLILCLEPLPDRFIFDFLNFSGRIDPKAMNRIEDIEKAKYPHEKTIYYCVAMASFGALLDVIVSISYIINSSGKNHRMTFTLLISGIITGILAGWTTCLPLFL